MEQRRQLEVDMDTRMCRMEEDAARHLASIRNDADQAQAALADLLTKNRELEEQYALVDNRPKAFVLVLPVSLQVVQLSTLFHCQAAFSLALMPMW